MGLEIDWSAPKTPCKTEGCPHPNYHICFFGQEVEREFAPEVFVREIKRKKLRPSRAYRGTPEEIEEGRRANIGVAQKARWDKYRRETEARDKKVVERYSAGDTAMATIQKEFNISRGKILRILHEAQDRGEVIIRTRGRTIASERKTA